MTRTRDDALLSAFAAVLRRLRGDLGISQEKLALKAGIDRTFLGKLETKKHQPSLAVLFAIAAAAEIAPSQLVVLIESELARVSA
ncbi:MAG: helix-turn-helix transcriptional regulator [Burkholderiales bacterium]|nr:helix-turn-helix transcriptional regulator [Burkholderiales bacterium]